MSPKSNIHILGSPTGCPLGADIDIDIDVDIDEFEVTKGLYDKIMALDKCMFDVNEDDVEQHIPFDPSRYPDGENGVCICCLLLLLLLLFLLGLELMIGSIERRNWDNILIKPSPTN